MRVDARGVDVLLFMLGYGSLLDVPDDELSRLGELGEAVMRGRERLRSGEVRAGKVLMEVFQGAVLEVTPRVVPVLSSRGFYVFDEPLPREEAAVIPAHILSYIVLYGVVPVRAGEDGVYVDGVRVPDTVLDGLSPRVLARLLSTMYPAYEFKVSREGLSFKVRDRFVATGVVTGSLARNVKVSVGGATRFIGAVRINRLGEAVEEAVSVLQGVSGSELEELPEGWRADVSKYSITLSRTVEKGGVTVIMAVRYNKVAGEYRATVSFIASHGRKEEVKRAVKEEWGDVEVEETRTMVQVSKSVESIEDGVEWCEAVAATV